MSWTAHSDEEQIKETVEAQQNIHQKAKQLANLIKKSKHFIIFTGAGISTSAGIPDFRGPTGVWTLMKQGKKRVGKTTPILQAMPTKTHMAIVKLQQVGICKYLISQNVDGLHLKSGIDPKKISELHGNTNLETCSKCGKRYLRDFRTREARGVNDHRTSRFCKVKGCGARLKDSIINFGESLPQEAMELGFEHSNKADLCLVLGSSLTVTPAADMPEIVGNKSVKSKSHTLCIVNLQKTPHDDVCSLRVFAKCDEFMELVMKELNLDIPPFTLTRICRVIPTQDKKQLIFSGVDTDGTPTSFIRAIEYKSSNVNHQIVKAEPFVVSVAEKLNVVVHFMGHYKEPPLALLKDCDPTQLLNAKQTIYFLNYNPSTGVWKVIDEDKQLLKSIEKLAIENSTNNNNNNNDMKQQLDLPNECTLTVGNTHQKVKDKHKWKCYVTTDHPDCIEKVVFIIHNTFNPNVIECKQHPFEITKTGWGFFDVEIEIHWNKQLNKETTLLTHPLNFQKNDTNSKHKFKF